MHIFLLVIIGATYLKKMVFKIANESDNRYNVDVKAGQPPRRE